MTSALGDSSCVARVAPVANWGVQVSIDTIRICSFSSISSVQNCPQNLVCCVQEAVEHYFPQSRPRRATPQLIAPLPLIRLGGSSGQSGGVPNPGGGLVSWGAPVNGWRYLGPTI